MNRHTANRHIVNRHIANRHIVNRHIGISLIGLLTIGIFLLTACDPIYHLQYAVMNDTDQPIYCVDKAKTGVGRVIRIEPDSFVEVYDEAGIGFAKPQFRESKPEVATRFVFYTDSTLADSTQVTSGKGWKYYRLPIDAYNARVYIRQKDLEKK